MSLKLIQVYFDGGAYGNGHMFQGYGSYEIDGGPLLKHKSLRQDFGAPITCNQAEYLSLIAALKWLKHHVDPKETRLLIKGDSQLVVFQVKRRWKARCLRMVNLLKEARELLAPYAHWEINWHRRNNSVARFGH